MDQLILFFKEPIIGQVKTRLAKDIGFYSATEFYNEILFSLLKSVVHPDLYHVTYAIPEESGKFFIQRLKDVHPFTNVVYQSTKATTIGGKLDYLFKSEFQKLMSLNTSTDLKKNKIIVIGGDCPFITLEDIQHAFQLMEESEGVLGPSSDGGYYLIGLKESKKLHKHLELFKNIPWSTNQVLTKTKEKIEQYNFNFSFLKEKYDIDTKADYERYLHDQSNHSRN